MARRAKGKKKAAVAMLVDHRTGAATPQMIPCADEDRLVTVSDHSWWLPLFVCNHLFSL